MNKEYLNKLTEQIIGLAIKVHRTLGPGLLESAYEACLAFEFTKAGLRFERQKMLPIKYENVEIDNGYRMDLLVEDSIVVELKAVEKVDPIHQAQLLTYLKLSEKKAGLLINFNVKLLKNGIHRMINGIDL